MALPWHLVASTVAYVAIAICGFLISVPMGITKVRFDNILLIFFHLLNVFVYERMYVLLLS